MRHARFISVAIVLLAGACGSGTAGMPAPAQAPGAAADRARAAGAAGPTLATRAGSPGFYSTAQAERGRASYDAACKECHPPSQFRGPDFEWRWRRQSAWELFEEIAQRMPENRPGELPAETYADIVAYLLSLNEYQAGSAELPPARDALAGIPLGAGVSKTRSPGADDGG